MSYPIEFHSVAVKPEPTPHSNDYLIINSCEGYSLVKGDFDPQGCFIHFWGWVAGEIQFYSPGDYDSWAILPNSLKIKAGS